MNTTGENGPPAVRILPPDGRHEMRQTSPEEDPTRRWLPVALGLVAATLGLLFVLTLPDRDAQTTATTSPPRLISEFEATVEDLTTTPDAALAEGWKSVTIDDGFRAQVRSVVASQERLIAVGSHEGLPQVWISGNGFGWRPVANIEIPEAENQTTYWINEVIDWNEGTVAVGAHDGEVAVWYAEHPDTWEYRGKVPGFPEATFPNAAADDILLLMAPSDTGHHVWTAHSAFDWSGPIETSGLSDMLLGNLAAADGWFYALGSECGGDDCKPVIYRSDEGDDWTQTHTPDGGPISEQGGSVRDLVSTDAGYLAIGMTLEGDAPQPALWQSIDGATWSPMLAPAVFAGESMDLELAQVELGVPNRATLRIDGIEHAVTVDSALKTDAGSIVVTGVDEAQVRLSIDGTPFLLNPGEPGTVTRIPYAADVTAQGSRIAIAGFLQSTSTLPTLSGDVNSSVAAVWTSPDNGNTWERTVLPGEDSQASSVGLMAHNISVVGGSPLEAAAWHGQWNTDFAEGAAVDAIRRFFADINTHDADQLEVPTNAPGLALLQLPSLGGVELNWWEGGISALDQTAVDDTLAYLHALNTHTEVKACSTSVRVGEIDTVRAVCGFTVTSDLMAALGVPEGEGRLEANYQNGILTKLDLHSAPSLSTWHLLSDWAIDTGIDTETVGTFDINGDWQRPPVFTASSAAVHLDLASQFSATMLLPGTTRISETPFGLMEWQWLETLPGDLSFVESVVHTEIGFIAVGRESRGSQSAAVWRSDDGLAWEALPSPGVISIQTLVPFRGGALAVAGGRDGAVVVLYDGEGWTQLELPPEGQEHYGAFVTTNGDEALMIVYEFSLDEEPPELSLWRLGADNSLTQGTPPWSDEDGWPIGVASLNGEYVMAVVSDPTSDEFRPYRSEDGLTWDPLTESVKLEEAVYLWRMDRHGDGLLVFGELREQRCTDAGAGSSCAPVQAIWQSDDGIEWKLVESLASRPIVSPLVGSGELGLVALGLENFDSPTPQPIYLSKDGEDWVRPENLTLFDPAASWSWGNIPAVSDDTIIIHRISESDFGPDASGDPQKYWLIIGKLLEER